MAVVAVLLIAATITATLLVTKGGRSTEHAATTVETLPADAPSRPTATASPSAGITTPATSSVPPPLPAGFSTTDLAAPTSEQTTFPLDPTKCGPDPPNNGPYRTDGRYEVTATVKLWSGPSISSTPIARVDVDSYGPGGIGCPDGAGPFVQVICRTQGDTINGPFGSVARWEKVHVTGLPDSYISDEWLDTKWDGDGFPTC
ncbi:MAG: hypothetical protein JST73_12095 [Actinobacteria bacterium]|nr:hypothetical protein [Actinomycetota bacterium]